MYAISNAADFTVPEGGWVFLFYELTNVIALFIEAVYKERLPGFFHV
jgi:hypothetical protein